MTAKLLTFLFFPWVDAALRAAYNMYLSESRVFGSEERQVRQFMKYHVGDYMKKAFEKHYLRIMFAPWTIVTSSELYEYKFA